MLQHPRLQIDISDGIAQIQLATPGPVLNGLDTSALAELQRSLSTLEQNSALEIVVLRSAWPAGFCAGFAPAALASLATSTDAALFAARGQQLLDRLSDSPLISLAFIEGPCLGPGLELAAACDYAIGISGPDSQIGFGLSPLGWGGRSRLRQRVGARRLAQFERAGFVSARVAAQLGVLDDAFSARRGKIELRTWLDRLQARPRKRRPKWWHWWFSPRADRAGERRDFARSILELGHDALGPEAAPPLDLPAVIALFGHDPELLKIAYEAALRGCSITFQGDSDGLTGLAGLEAQAIASGRITPLEASQARAQFHPAGRRPSHCSTAKALWALAAHDAESVEISPRSVVCTRLPSGSTQPSRHWPGALTLQPLGEGWLQVECVTEEQHGLSGRVAGWLRRLGYRVDIRCPAEQPTCETKLLKSPENEPNHPATEPHDDSLLLTRG